jgi:hypothetical protein
LAAINPTAAKLVPEPEQSGMLGQRVAAEALHRAILGELHNPRQIALQVRRQNCGLPE